MTWKGRSEPNPEPNGRQFRSWERPLGCILKLIVAGMVAFAVILALTILLSIIRGVADAAGHAAAVVDGDTLRWRGERVRFVGMDAPECRQTCQRSGGAAY